MVGSVPGPFRSRRRPPGVLRDGGSGMQAKQVSGARRRILAGLPSSPWAVSVTLSIGFSIGPVIAPVIGTVIAPVIGSAAGPATGLAIAAEPSRDLILATTTSTQDTGLLDFLLPVFEKDTGYRVRTIAVGSGQALALGQRGEADVLLVHSPEAEEAFMAAGLGGSRRAVMHNDFVIIGPADDPAALRGAGTAAEGLRRIAAHRSLFVSRGDNSGTHVRERALWQAAGVDPAGSRWYLETGLGMGQTLAVAAERQAYTLVDRGTWLALREHLGLVVLLEEDPPLWNPYHVIEVNSRRWPKVNAAAARAFADFLVSRKGQGLIAMFDVPKYGRPLFVPDADAGIKATGPAPAEPKAAEHMAAESKPAAPKVLAPEDAAPSVAGPKGR
jgi:tungstate transport system substrate-binding protein